MNSKFSKVISSFQAYEIVNLFFFFSQICSGKVQVYTTEGEHETMLQSPGVEKVSSIMKDMF